jgi:hypothetical protein
MNCREWEERIAGDLDDPAVVEHVAECAGCRVFASGLRETIEWLREGHREEIAPGAYAAVRSRVRSELAARRRWGWVWVAGVVAAGLVLGVGVRSKMRVEELPGVALAVPKAPVASAAAPLRRMPARKPEWRAGGSRTGGKLHQRTEEVVVKIETGDPDVVIYWIAETKGDY